MFIISKLIFDLKEHSATFILRENEYYENVFMKLNKKSEVKQEI